MKETKKLKVGLIEDDVSLAKMYRIKMMNAGFDVVWAKNGQEAMQIMPTEKPDYILLDIMLPDISGLEVLERLINYEETKNIPVTMLTVLPEIIALKKAIKLGAKGYLIKSDNTPDTVVDYVKTELKLI